MTHPRSHFAYIPWARIGKRYWSFFILAAILPIIIFAATGNRAFFVMDSQAAQVNELRIWVEPNSLVTNLDQAVRVRVMGYFGGNNKLLKKILVSFPDDMNLEVSPQELNYTSVLTGQVQLGEVEIVGKNLGTWHIAPTIQAFDGSDTLYAPTVLPIHVSVTSPQP